MLELLEEFSVKGSTNIIAPEEFFPGKMVKVDLTFRGFLALAVESGISSADEIDCKLYGMAEGTPDMMIRTSGVNTTPTPAQVCSLLRFLGAEGDLFLAIPEGADEVNIILCYVLDGNRELVLYVEHELEDGVEEIHLHAGPVDNWGDEDKVLFVEVIAK